MGKFYVYILSDPRDGKPFYVGKGKGKRMGAHAFEGGDSAKARKIREITESGRGIEYRIDSEWLLEAAATDRERELIKTLPGLTNIVHNNEKTLRWYSTELFFRVVEAAGEERRYYARKFMKLFPQQICEKYGIGFMWEQCNKAALTENAVSA